MYLTAVVLLSFSSASGGHLYDRNSIQHIPFVVLLFILFTDCFGLSELKRKRVLYAGLAMTNFPAPEYSSLRGLPEEITLTAYLIMAIRSDLTQQSITS